MATKEFFTVRLNRILIKNNREFGKAEIKILSFITIGNKSLPALNGYINTNDDAEKKEIIKKATLQAVSQRELIEVHHVRDDSILTFGDAGISVHTSDEIPRDFNWSLVVIESDKKLRTLTSQLKKVVESEEFEGFSNNIITSVAGEISPQLKLAANITNYIAKVGLSLMANNKDDQVGLFYTSLNRFQHYVNGERKKDNVPGVNDNIKIDYTVFGTRY